MINNVLSIDFDYWYLGYNPDETYHCGWCKDKEKTGRPKEKDFRFSAPEIKKEEVINLIKEKTPIYVSDCHADIINVLEEIYPSSVNVYNIDSHSDTKYTINRPLYCGNWVNYAMESMLLDKYTHVRSWGFFIVPTPDIVFVCKSPAYLLETGDVPFIGFVNSLAAKSKVDVTWL